MNAKIAGSVITFVAASSLAFANPVDLTGRITLPNQSVRATILICCPMLKSNFESSVTMRSPLLPAHAQTDEQGDFTFASVDSRGLYIGYAMAPGCQLKWLPQIDPSTGPLNISLDAADTNLAPDKILHGRVLGPNGQPVPGALIEITGSTRNGEMSWPSHDVDLYAVSDDAGNFVITGKTPFDAVDGTVSADGFADADFDQWPSDAANREWADTGEMPRGLAEFAKPLHEITLIEGALLEGRLLSSGEPVTNAEIRLNACAAGSTCWDFKLSTLTDAQGHFIFPHLSTNQSFSICGSWDLFASGCAVPQTNVRLGDNGSDNNMGDINSDPVCAVTGRIVLSDGKPLPPKSFYYLGDNSMGISPSSPFGNDGSFQFPEVPGHRIYMFVRIPGYVFTPRDYQLKSGSMTNIIASAESTNLVFTMRPYTRPRWPR